MERTYFVYILTNKKNGTLYVGVTNDLARRIWEHKQKLVDGFTKQYGLTRLVYYELAENPEAAITREKQLKAGSRKKKIVLIEKMNPDWKDLSDEL